MGVWDGSQYRNNHTALGRNRLQDFEFNHLAKTESSAQFELQNVQTFCGVSSLGAKIKTHSALFQLRIDATTRRESSNDRRVADVCCRRLGKNRGEAPYAKAAGIGGTHNPCLDKRRSVDSGSLRRKRHDRSRGSFDLAAVYRHRAGAHVCAIGTETVATVIGKT